MNQLELELQELKLELQELKQQLVEKTKCLENEIEYQNYIDEKNIIKDKIKESKDKDEIKFLRAQLG